MDPKTDFDTDTTPDSQARVAWQRATLCMSGMCVEVARPGPDTVLLRDSKETHLAASQTILELSAEGFLALVDQLGPESPHRRTEEILVVRRLDGETIFRSRSTGVELRFDQGEIDAFVAGIRAGEFTPEALMQPAG